MLPSRRERHAVVRPRQVLGREPEVDGVLGDLVEAEGRRELRLDRLLAAEHRRRRLADHLDVAHRVLEAGHPEVEVVHAERLLELRRVLLLRDRQDRGAVVEHVVAADLVGAVGEAVRVAVVGRGEQQRRRVRGAGRDDDDVAAERRLLAALVDLDAGHGRPRVVGRQARRPGVRQERHVRVPEGRPDPEDLGVGLAQDERREAVAGRAADADAVRLVALEQPDAARRVERVVAGPLEVVRQLLDPRLVRHGRERIGAARPGLGRVLGVVAVDLVELLGPRVVRLEVVVRDRPGGRDPVVVAQLAEVLLPEPVERRAVELRLAADVVVDARLEALAAARRTTSPSRRSGS